MTPEQLQTALWTFTGKVLIVYLIAAFVSGLVNSVIAKHTDIGRDDTDPNGGRSNLLVLTDAKTGCQYLTSNRGGITPRLDADGKQICSKGGAQ